MRSLTRFALPMALAASLCVVTCEAASARRTPEARLASVEATSTGPIAGSGGILDPDLQAPPPTSEDALVARLVALGADRAAAWQAVADLAPWQGQAEATPELAANALARLGLPEPVAVKADVFARAYLAGQPVSLAGTELPETMSRRIAELHAEGLAPESAAWLARQEWQAQLSPGDPAPRLAASLEVLALDDDLRSRVGQILTGGAPMVRGSTQEQLASIDAHRLDDDRIAPSPTPLASCVACPAFNYGSFSPTTTQQYHASSIGGTDCRVYRFSLVSGHTYRFSFCDGSATATFDTAIESSTYQGAVCAGGPSGSTCSGNLDSLDYTATYSGFFFVKVRNLDPTAGTYRLGYRDTTPSCNVCPAYDYTLATPTASYQTHSSSIGALECRTYKVSVQANHQYRFTLCDPDSVGVASGASSSFNADLSATNSACAPIGTQVGSCAPGHELDVTPTAAGSIFVTVRGDSISDTGSYTLAYRDLARCATCPAQDFGPFTPTQVYQQHSSSITADNCKLYRFNVTAGHTYRFVTCSADSDSNPTGASHGFDTELTAYNASCAFLANNDDLPTCTPIWGSELNVTPAYTGALFLRVFGHRTTEFGAYTLAYRDLAGVCKTCPAYDAAANNPTTTYQQLPASSIELNGGCYNYRFQLTAGNRYRFTFCDPDGSGVASGGAATFDTVLEIRSSTCTLLASNDDGPCGTSSELDYTATATGFHYVKVRGKTPTDAGTFTLAYRQFAGICRTCPSFDYGTFTPNQFWATHSGTVAAEACRIYRFQLTGGRLYEFSLCNGGGTATFAATVTAKDAACTVIPSVYNDCPPQDLFFTPSSTGVYYVAVAGQAPTDNGSYTLAYREYSASCEVYCPAFEFGPFLPITAVKTHSDFIEPYCYWKTYAFTMTSGVTYHFSTCPPGSAAFDSALELLDNSCVVVANPTDTCGDDATLDYTSTFTGQGILYVYLQGGFGSPGGAYTLAYWRDP